jgi:hypothetical protein
VSVCLSDCLSVCVLFIFSFSHFLIFYFFVFFFLSSLFLSSLPPFHTLLSFPSFFARFHFSFVPSLSLIPIALTPLIPFVTPESPFPPLPPLHNLNTTVAGAQRTSQRHSFMGASTTALGSTSHQPIIQIVHPPSTSPLTTPLAFATTATNSDSSRKSPCKSTTSTTTTAVDRGCNFVYSLIEGSYNRITAWLFPNEPEPLDLQATLFFMAQAPFIGLVFLYWLPVMVSWLLGFRTSQAGNPGPAQGMRK